MQPAEQGRHCAACQKTVVDFTNMNDAEILRHLSRAASPVCGRLMPDQQNRQLVPSPPLAKSRWPGWQWLLTGLLLVSDTMAWRGASRPPLREQRISFRNRDAGEKVTGIVLSSPAIKAPPQVDTAIEAIPVAELGDIGVMLIDPAAERNDTLLRPTCPPDVDSDTLPISHAVTGEVKVMVDPIIQGDSITQGDTIKHPLNITPADTPTGDSHQTRENALHIYPNPISRGAAFRVTWPAGSAMYQVTLFSAAGTPIQQRIVVVSGPQQVNTFQLPPGLASGMYIFHAACPGQTIPFTAKLLVQ